MSYRRLFVFLEGEDDERFFRAILMGRMERKYDDVLVWKYAEQTTEKLRGFLRSAKRMGADCIYLTDINRAPCVTAKKRQVQAKLRDIEDSEIAVVVREIESWYLAGMTEETANRLGVRPPSSTDSLTKEQFDALIPGKFASRRDFMIEALGLFSVDAAKRKNASFRHFVEKHICRSAGWSSP